ncbi:hypothetical protein M405DRAFT_804919 [Rhizopogon salebrosus TDB-379]|nr:hypothetical protein M405DRAFT_804919 [Rhizopogon salebrosus TDB-379]
MTISPTLFMACPAAPPADGRLHPIDSRSASIIGSRKSECVFDIVRTSRALDLFGGNVVKVSSLCIKIAVMR